MNNTVVEKTEARKQKSKEWTISNDSGHFLRVIFSLDLENNMKNVRNFSFNRFESEQLNNLSPLVPDLKEDFELTLDEGVIGNAFLPLDAKSAQPLFKKID
ncbi:hypothetical protein LFYK43_12640 [Ligilactobacillus salitolerans]|uniref:Uncharacterized protein n=1 Tax=Ligilactobacillus salitolerans TaxID=1808352 RepID=A0A401ITI0_9LACO|nr:hypothetical protein [Ligilactobacillus salitolerans]GBG94805.1 hypothetical protein LFYK43_12640 [Ligilactobacillus salitolerans]